MKALTIKLLGATLLASIGIASAKTIVVNTVNNADFSAGQTNLVQALNLLQDGDTIHFDIPGSGVHYLDTPADGYPLITASRITIDGYSQPGALPNSNPLHAANNAQLKIVLTSTNGNGLSMQTAITNHTGIPNDNLGFGPDELAILGFYQGSNNTVKGLGFLSTMQANGSGFTGDMKAISFCPDRGGQCANWQVSGCWFGLDPETRQVAYMADAITVAIPTITIAAYWSHDPDGSNPTYPQTGTIGVSSNSPNPRAEFNVIITGYGFDAESFNHRISGNFWNVLPDGMNNFDPSMANGGKQLGDAYIECGRVSDNLLIGTDGDGVNDADEGNIFGGVWNTSWSCLNLWSAHATNVVIAGNWFGVAVDGLTRFTNSSVLVDSFPSTARVRFGSDFDGVSDTLEANTVAMNYPFDTLFPSPSSADQLQMFAKMDTGAQISLRGNTLIGNNIPPLSYGALTDPNILTNFYTNVLAVSQVIPSLSTNSSTGRIKGVCDPGLSPYTNVIIDLYVADPEAWTNGQKLQLAALQYFDAGSGSFQYYGFAEGRTYLASFLDNGPADLDPAVGRFEFNIGSLHLTGGTQVTVAASYSADPPGTHNSRTQTSPFSMPVSLQSSPHVSITLNGNSIILSWPQSDGLFTIQSSAGLSPASWSNLTPQPPITLVGANYQASVPISGSRAFFRLAR